MQIFVDAEECFLRQVLGIDGKTPVPQKVQHRGLKSPQQLLKARLVPRMYTRKAMERLHGMLLAPGIE